MTKLVPRIIYEDSDILVIDKPSGLVVNRAETVKGGWTVQDWLPNETAVGIPSDVYEKVSEFELRRGVIHRLDKDTSGVMVVAKNRGAFENIQKQFKERAVKKEYLALVHGDISKLLENAGPAGSPACAGRSSRPMSSVASSLRALDGTPPASATRLDSPSYGNMRFSVDAPIGRNPRNRMKWAVVEGGREAVTEFEVIDTFRNILEDRHEMLGVSPPPVHIPPESTGAFLSRSSSYIMGELALLRCLPRTGRTHQIRVHLTAVNCPIVCDKLYLGRKQYREDIKWCPRIFLHAEKLGFKHPKSGEWVEYTAKIPEELRDVLAEFTFDL